MKNKVKLIILACCAVLCFIVNMLLSPITAEEIISTDWVVNPGATDLTVSDISNGGVATVSYYKVPSDSALNSVTVKVSNYDIVDDYLSIKYSADFPVGGSNITINISYSSGSDESTGEDYEGGTVLTGWFENWNVEKGKSRDGYDMITMNIGTYTSGRTVNGIIFSFSYAGNTSTAKTIQFLGIDLHPGTKAPAFVTDPAATESPIYLEQWEPDKEAGNIEYSTLENGDTTIHFGATPTGKSRIVAPLSGHEVSLLPTLKVKYSCTKEFNLAIYINGTSTSILSYTAITDNEGVLSFDLDKTMTKLCLIVDRVDYCNKSTYTTESPTKDIYLQFYFVDAEGNEVKVASVANNNNSGGGSTTPDSGDSGSGSGSGSGGITQGNITIGAWEPDKDAGNIEYSVNAQGQTVINYASAPTGKGRIIAPVTGHSVANYPTLQVKYSCLKEFNLAVYINGTSTSLLSYTDITDNEGVLNIDLTKVNKDMTKLCIIVDRSDKCNMSTYTTDSPSKTITLEFAFLDKDGNPAGSGNAGGSGSGTTNPNAVVTMGAWENESAGNMGYSVNAQGQTVIQFTAGPTSKSRIYASVSGHSVTAHPTLQIKYSCSKEFNLAVYINGTSTSIVSYTAITDNEGVITIDLSDKGIDITKIYLMVDRNGYHNADTYSDGTGKTVYLEFIFLDQNGNPVS